MECQPPETSHALKFPLSEKSHLPSPPLHGDGYYGSTMAAPERARYGQDREEVSYLEDIRAEREREDARLDITFRDRQAAIDHRMTLLLARRQNLENDLQQINRSLAEYDSDRAIEAHRYKDEKERISATRRDEDWKRAEWFRNSRTPGLGVPREDRLPSPRSQNLLGRQLPLPTDHRGWASINRAPTSSQPENRGSLMSSVYHNPVEATGNGNQPVPLQGSRRPNGTITDLLSHPEDDAASAQRRNNERLLKPKDRQSLPGFHAVIESAGVSPPSEIAHGEMDSTVAKSRKSLPNVKVASKKNDVNTNDGREITRENLVMRYNSFSVVGPPMFEGCPLERIDESHPYWEAEWQSLEEIIQPQIDKWKEKLETLRQTTNAVRHTIFLANRQVNRGNAIMNHLKDKTAFHPFQFVGKEMMTRFYKTFVNYDTMFRLCNVHDELKKFDLDVTPLEWMRQRMFEIATAYGEKFSLSKTTHDLYHDPKLKALREKHGFGNIGRPSGYKLGERGANKGSVSKVKEMRSPAMTVSSADADMSPEFSRRSSRRSIGQVEPDDSPTLPPITQAYGRTSMYSTGSSTPPMQKRQKLDPKPDPHAEREDELDYEGYTSHDSFSGGRIGRLDFRVDQIKTRSGTTNPDVTQYWTWKSDQMMFIHQVLRDVRPGVTWASYDDSNSYDLHLNKLIEIQHHPDTTKILVSIGNNGEKDEILAQFQRDRTRRRFLDFARKKEVKLVRVDRVSLEQAWENVNSEMPSNVGPDS